MIQQLDVITVIDTVLGTAPVSGGISAGTYLALAALNRICDPRSKRAFSRWWATTALGRITKIPAGALDHRRFWDAMDRVTVDEAGIDQVDDIEAALTRAMIDVFALDTHALILDQTNFATFIDSTNDRAPIAQRGKAKQKRYDLRIVGLGVVATRDGGIPLLSRAYPGNKVDVTQFTPMIEELARRYAAILGRAGGATVTFDAGQNSEVNFTRLGALHLHFVGSVPPSAKVEAEIDQICAPRWVARVIKTELTGQDPPTLRLAWRIDPHAQAALEEELFGKRILVTDHDDWPIEQVIDAYRSQEDLEAGFRQAKDTHVVSFAPIRHFTDHKIRVHLFTCVLALAIAHLMRRQAAQAGITTSVPALLEDLEGIGETVLLYQGEKGRPRARHQITRMDPH
jgi:transposase